MFSAKNLVYFGLIVAAFAVIGSAKRGADFFLFFGRRQAPLLLVERAGQSSYGATAQPVSLP